MLAASAALTAAACSRAPNADESAARRGEPIPLRHARFLTLERRDGLIIARLKAPVSGGGGANEERTDLIVLAGSGAPEPILDGDLRGATVIRTPVRTAAANASSDEAFMGALGVKDRLVAVGGLLSYDDDVRARATRGEIGQIGYNWHTPPNLDVLLTRRPDLFLMRLSDLAHTPVLERARSVGLTVLPTFAEEERSYLARAEWIRFYGLVFGREAEAERIFSEVEANVTAIKARVAEAPRVPVLWAYPAGADRWIAVVRGAEGRYLIDAGGDNLLTRPEDPRRYAEESVSTEVVLPLADRAEVWINGDIHAVAPRNRSIEPSFKAWREGRLFGNTGRTHQAVNVHDWYQSAFVRPDWVLSDFAKALHPDRIDEPFRFLKPLAQGQYQ